MERRERLGWRRSRQTIPVIITGLNFVDGGIADATNPTSNVIIVLLKCSLAVFVGTSTGCCDCFGVTIALGTAVGRSDSRW